MVITELSKLQPGSRVAMPSPEAGERSMWPHLVQSNEPRGDLIAVRLVCEADGQITEVTGLPDAVMQQIGQDRPVCDDCGQLLLCVTATGGGPEGWLATDINGRVPGTDQLVRTGDVLPAQISAHCAADARAVVCPPGAFARFPRDFDGPTMRLFRTRRTCRGIDVVDEEPPIITLGPAWVTVIAFCYDTYLDQRQSYREAIAAQAPARLAAWIAAVDALFATTGPRNTALAQVLARHPHPVEITALVTLDMVGSTTTWTTKALDAALAAWLTTHPGTIDTLTTGVAA